MGKLVLDLASTLVFLLLDEFLECRHLNLQFECIDFWNLDGMSVF